MMQVVVGEKPVLAGEKPGGIRTPLKEELRWEMLSAEELATLASTPSFLGDTRTFVLMGALGGERGEEFLELAPGLAASPHTFIFEEEKLLKKPAEILAKAGAQVTTYPPKKKEAAFDIFSLANGFAARDRKKFWLLLARARRAGAAPEAVAGMLHWKVRDLLAKGSGKYTAAELKGMSRTLVALYHDSHRGGGELDLLLERFALNL